MRHHRRVVTRFRIVLLGPTLRPLVPLFSARPPIRDLIQQWRSYDVWSTSCSSEAVPPRAPSGNIQSRWPADFRRPQRVLSMSQALLDMLRDPVASGASLVIDALDECETGLSQLLDLIVETMSARYNVKWIVSSRSRHETEQRLRLNDSRTRLSLELNAEHIAQAIYHYVDFKISSLVSLRDNESFTSRGPHKLLQALGRGHGRLRRNVRGA